MQLLQWFMVLLAVVVFVCLSMFLVGFVRRKKKLGVPLQRFGSFLNPLIITPLMYPVFIYMMIRLLFIQFDNLHRYHQPGALFNLIMNGLNILFTIYLVVIFSILGIRRKTIHEHGLLSPGRIVFWTEIKSCRWLGDDMMEIHYTYKLLFLKLPVFEKWYIPEEVRPMVRDRLQRVEGDSVNLLV